MAGKIERIREAIAACFEMNQPPLSKAQVVDWVAEHYGSNTFNPSTFSMQLSRSCVNLKSAIKSSAPKILFYNKDDRTFVRSSPEQRVEFDRHYRGATSADDATKEDESSETELNSRFALESHLRDYLARNLGLLEKELSLWTGEIGTSIEFAIEGRRIDILAKDSSGLPVVIELKLSKGHEKTLGQSLYYRAKLKQILNVARIRIIMVAAEISEELKIASTEIIDVDLFSYALTMQVQKLNVMNGPTERGN
jgi:hypothetical protein